MNHAALAWLSIVVLGNPLHAWLIAAAWLGGVAVVVRALKPRLVAHLGALAAHTGNTWDDAAVRAIASTRVGLLTLAALAPVEQNLVLGAGLQRWIAGVATAALFAQIGLWAGRFIDDWIKTSRDRAMLDDPETATGLAATSFIARVVLWSVLVLLLLDNLGFNITTLLAGLGVGGVAVGLALQNILGDLFSSLSIVLDKPFQIGHFVVVDQFSGTVENIGLKTTRIRSIGGELLVFSNTDLTKARLRNYRMMQERRIVFAFGVTFDTPADALATIPGLVRELIGAQPNARFDRAHFKDIGDSALSFEVVYWMTTSDYTVYMDTQQAINIGLVRAFAERGIDFAFPTRTVVVDAAAPLPVVVRRPAARS